MKGLEREKGRTPLDNSLVAFVVSVVVLTIVGMTYLELWSYLYSIVVAWVISDFLITLIVRGGGGILQIPLYGTRIQTKGRGYLAFLIGIIIGTWLSTFFSDMIFNLLKFGVSTVAISSGANLSSPQADWLTVFVSSLVVGALAFIDLNVRFYGRE